MEIFDFIKEYWAILLAFVGVITSFTHLKNQNGQQEKRICKLEKDIDALNPIWIEIKERLVAIETTLKILTKDK